MSTLEKSLWNYVRSGMSGRWDASRHTDVARAGVPDVSFGMDGINGWIELKVIPAFPKRESTPVRIDHFTREQRMFLRARGRAGGYCFFLLRVGRREHILVPWYNVPLVDDWTRADLIRAGVHFQSGIDWDRFADALKMKVPGVGGRRGRGKGKQSGEPIIIGFDDDYRL